MPPEVVGPIGSWGCRVDSDPIIEGDGGYRWSKKDVPRRGWVYHDCIDTGSPDSECDMCGNPNVRYLHVMSHDDYSGFMEVGCVCAEHMVAGYMRARPKERERALKSRARRRRLWEAHREERRSNWTDINCWHKTRNGNIGRRIPGGYATVFKRNGAWRFVVNGVFSAAACAYASPSLAIAAAFEAFDKFEEA